MLFILTFPFVVEEDAAHKLMQASLFFLALKLRSFAVSDFWSLLLWRAQLEDLPSKLLHKRMTSLRLVLVPHLLAGNNQLSWLILEECKKGVLRDTDTFK